MADSESWNAEPREGATAAYVGASASKDALNQAALHE